MRLHSIARTSMTIAVLTWATTACQTDRACERQRLDLAKTFQQVKLTAADAKKLDRERSSKMSTEAKQAHHDHWAKIENKAELLESAFYTSQVTWDSAATALGDAQNLYQEGHGDGILEQGFGGLLQQGASAFAAFRKSCR